jgi:hypothetical protein
LMEAAEEEPVGAKARRLSKEYPVSFREWKGRLWEVLLEGAEEMVSSFLPPSTQPPLLTPPHPRYIHDHTQIILCYRSAAISQQGSC